MNHDALEQQTAPESTRGLFDTEGASMRVMDKRRTFNGLMLTPSRHQRSRSAIQVVPSRSSLQPLKEEMTVDSLQDMINTLKTLPPIASEPRPRVSSSSSRLLDKRNSDENIFLSREAALAEAEAKLMGTYQRSNEKRSLPVLAEHGPTLDEWSTKRNTKSLSLSLGQSNRRSSQRLDDWRNSSGSSYSPTPSASVSSNRSSFSLVPFTPTRVNFSRDDANPHQRRPLFIAHLPFSGLTPLFRSRQLVRGIIRVNKRNRSDAYVTCDELDGCDIYVCGSRDRNRALEGDVVAIRLVNVEKVIREKQEKEEAKLARNHGHVKTRLPDEEDENEIIFGGDEEIDAVKPKYAGVVVAILERAQNQVFSGTLTLSRPNNKRAAQLQLLEETSEVKKEAPRIVWFKATDKRVPLIAIPIEQVPDDFVDNNDAYINKLFVGSIKRWPITSLHPFGTLEKELGLITDLDVQIKAILADNNVTDAPFSDAVMQCVPPTPFSFSSSPDRRDLVAEKHQMITLDPPGSTILEDGISVVRLGEDTFEVGVHVADISYFIKPHSPLDKEARARAVHVFMDQKNVPMLPTELIQIAQFNLNELKPAISVIWKMSSDGTILDTWFGKTTVKSTARLDYDTAQVMLHKKENDQLVMLNQIATCLYYKRHTKECMSLARHQLEFDDPLEPKKATLKTSLSQIAQVMKEFAFLANKCVAQKISSQYPEQALLRRQGPPHPRKLSELKDYLARYLGVQLNTSSAIRIQESIEAIEDSELSQLVSVLVLKTMLPPKYFCTGVFDISKYAHYASGVPLFTHFTAPLRRFADIIVHRQLESCLLGEKHFFLDRDTVQKLAQHCNVKKEASLVARDQGKLLSLALYLVQKQQQQDPHQVVVTETKVTTIIYHEARVIAVMPDCFDVSLPEFGMERRIHLANLPLRRYQFDPLSRALTLYWKHGVNPSTGLQEPWSLSDDEYEEEELLLNYIEQKRQEQLVDIKETPDLSQKKSASKRASIISSRLSTSTGYSTEQGSHTLKAMDKIRVMLTIEMVRTPPLIRVFAANPYA
ncbi:hypothetical protein BDB01DRAFT_788489 [Pilobolus umbonatus]|nr:hypothetical protein BDB01DRAFT_788489 [Pilobolus umbonatus]